MAVVNTTKTVNSMEEVRNHHVFRQRLSSSNSNDRFPHIQCLEPFRLALTFPPCSFFSDVMEQRDYIPQAADHKLALADPTNWCSCARSPEVAS